MAKSNLVIVESPAKAKTIGKYLGPGYQVKASMGHVRDLPKSKLGVDVEHGFEPDYQPIKGKEDVISDLKKAAKGSEKVFLATDPDREGEAISWHLKELLNIPDDKTYRVTFNEITKKVVSESIAAPRAIDRDLVDAQQARRILDRIVGYELSPLLWKKIRRGLSAGRVQSVATRLVCEREEEIRAFQPQEYWSLDVDLARIAPNQGAFTAAFYGREKKQELHSEAEVQTVVDAVKAAPFTVTGVKRQDKTRSPAPPFITSTLQQEASRKLNMTPRRTMAVAQQLYEGVDIQGEGTVGLITYMRTDSLRLSEEALAAAKDMIVSRYGKEYYPEKTRHFKAKSNAQDAHEAIRPSDVRLTPEDIKKDLTSEQYRLYKLIWSRFLACQMANAVYDSVSIEVESAGYRFRANHSSLKFSGFTAVYVEGKDEEDEVKQSPLPDLKEGEGLKLTGTKPEQHFTQPPSRYTEATLIKALEEKGIGRPSTYAPTISTILDREYVVKEGKYLRTTPLGEVVTGLMKDKFPDIVDTTFTAKMEERLDQVEEGKENWKDLLGSFYGGFEEELHQAEQDLDGERIKIPDEVTRVRPAAGGEVGPVRPVPGLPRLSRVHLHPAHRGGDARQVPQVRRPHPEKDLQAGLHLLRLRVQRGQGGQQGPAVRLHDLGRAGEGQLPRVRLDHVQEVGPGLQKALLHQPRLRQLHPRGQAGRLQEEDRRGQGGRGDRRDRRAGGEEDGEKGGGQEDHRQKDRRGKDARREEDGEKARRQEDSGQKDYDEEDRH